MCFAICDVSTHKSCPGSGILLCFGGCDGKWPAICNCNVCRASLGPFGEGVAMNELELIRLCCS